MRDTGIQAWPAGQAEQLFAPFHQAGQIGPARLLAEPGWAWLISQALIALMGGAIGCRSEPGG